MWDHGLLILLSVKAPIDLSNILLHIRTVIQRSLPTSRQAKNFCSPGMLTRQSLTGLGKKLAMPKCTRKMASCIGWGGFVIRAAATMEEVVI